MSKELICSDSCENGKKYRIESIGEQDSNYHYRKLLEGKYFIVVMGVCYLEEPFIFNGTKFKIMFFDQCFVSLFDKDNNNNTMSKLQHALHISAIILMALAMMCYAKGW